MIFMLNKKYYKNFLLNQRVLRKITQRNTSKEKFQKMKLATFKISINMLTLFNYISHRLLKRESRETPINKSKKLKFK